MKKQSRAPKAIGWDWPLVKIQHGLEQRLYARSPTGQLVRVTDADIQKAVTELALTIGGFGKTIQ